MGKDRLVRIRGWLRSDAIIFYCCHSEERIDEESAVLMRKLQIPLLSSPRERDSGGARDDNSY